MPIFLIVRTIGIVVICGVVELPGGSMVIIF